MITPDTRVGEILWDLILLKPCRHAEWLIRTHSHLTIKTFWLTLRDLINQHGDQLSMVCGPFTLGRLTREWREWFLEEIKVGDDLMFYWSDRPEDADIQFLIDRLMNRVGGHRPNTPELEWR